MSIKIDKNEIQTKLCDKLKPSGWYNKLRGFILSHNFEIILDKLIEESNKDKKFTPPLKYVFRAFEECKYNDLKVIMIGSDPHPSLGVSDGISFSCSLTNKEQPSLRYIFNSIEEDYELAETYDRNVDLKRWSNQGILMLNCGLTCQVNNIGSHIGLWNPFITYLLDILNITNIGLIFVFIGAEAQKYKDLINESNHFIILTEHPNKANYSAGKWNNNNMFKKIDKIIEGCFKTKIIW